MHTAEGTSEYNFADCVCVWGGVIDVKARQILIAIWNCATNIKEQKKYKIHDSDWVEFCCLLRASLSIPPSLSQRHML